MSKLAIPEKRNERIEFLRENKSNLYSLKKGAIKHSDPLTCSFSPIDYAHKAIELKSLNSDDFSLLSVKLAINTTNIMDSHDDVHIPGLWNKTLQENKNILLLKEHKRGFEDIISDNIKASATLMSWSDLGYNYFGATEVLLFDTTLNKSRHEYMFNQYANGFVKQHSVGMQYVKLFLAINSDSKEDIEEKDVWDRYINQIVNRTYAYELGYFWAVTEAKCIEGSAVPLASNTATPVISIEPQKSTQIQQGEPHKALDFEKIANAFNQKKSLFN